MQQQIPPEQRAALAQQLGMSPEQLNQMMQVMGQMPPEAMAGMMQAMGGAGGGMPGGVPPGANVVQLTQEEAEAIERLTGMGFDKDDAVQAFLACDKNEMMAANLLMDDFSGGGGGFGGGGEPAAAPDGAAPDGAAPGDGDAAPPSGDGDGGVSAGAQG